MPMRIQHPALEELVIKHKMQNNNIRLFMDTKTTATGLIWVTAIEKQKI